MFGTHQMESEMHDAHERIVLKIEALKAENERLKAENERLKAEAESYQKELEIRNKALNFTEPIVAPLKTVHEITIPAGAKVTIEYPPCNA